MMNIMMNTMINKKARRGSVLLMVVGLLTILALLGSTFLFIARSNRKSSEALTYRYQATPLASGSLTRVKELLKQDLWIDPATTDGPYSNTSDSSIGTGTLYTASTPWKRFIDYPTTSHFTNDTQTSQCERDDWLSCLDPNGTMWRHITNLFPNTDAQSGSGPNKRVNNISLSPTPPTNLIDSDGDGIVDAYYGAGVSSHEAKVMNDRGEKYYVGVRVIDLGGLININTAAENGESGLVTLPNYNSPLNLNLREFLKTGGNYDKYDDLHRDRTQLNTSQQANENDLVSFFTNSASHVLTPTLGTFYRPFAIGDEMFLRWLGTDGLTNTGRVFDAIGSLGSFTMAGKSCDLRRYLTSYNCSRAIVRHPSDGSDPNAIRLANARIPVNTADYLDGESSTTPRPDGAKRKQAFYEAFAYAIGGDAPLDADRQKAAQIVANVWAYMAGPDLTKSYSFQPYELKLTTVLPTDTSSLEKFKAYGLQPDLIINEIYAVHEDNEDGTDIASGGYEQDWYWGYAIELYNPTANNIDLANYALVAPDDGNVATTTDNIASAILMPLSGTVPAGGYYIIYNFGHRTLDSGNSLGISLADTQTALNSLGFPTSTAANPNLNFSGSSPKTVNLIRVVGTEAIPVDSAINTDMGYTLASLPTDGVPPAAGFAGTWDAQRDDNGTRKRFYVAVYDTGQVKTLGAANTVPATTAIGGTDVLEGFDIMLKPVGGTLSISDLLGLSVVGPMDKLVSAGYAIAASNTRFNTFSSQLAADYANEESRGCFDLSGGPSTAGSKYPTLPLGTLIGELFQVVPTDQTRPEGIANLFTRQYGKVNINTATHNVLTKLPWPATVDGFTIDEIQKTNIANFIIAYRDKLALYSARTGEPGFMTPGEIALPLKDYLTLALGGAPTSFAIRDALYKPISNLVTVNSDVYAVYIYVKANPEGTAGDHAAKPGCQWRYMAIIDRSNCRLSTDSPAVLMFTELK